MTTRIVRLPRTVLRARPVIPPFGATRAFGAKRQEDDKQASLSNEEITKIVLQMDANAAPARKSEAPIKLTGRSGQLANELYAQGQQTKAFDKYVTELAAFTKAIENAGPVVERFFTTANYSPEECKKVVGLITTTAEPLAGYKDIKDDDVKELIVDNEGNMDTWRNVRKSVASINLSKEVKDVISTLASEGRLDLVKKVSSKAHDLKAITSKTVDTTVSSAVTLSKEQQDAVRKALAGYATGGVTLNVAFLVDPAVLGGLQVTFKNQTIDLSAATRLLELSAASHMQQKMQ